MQFQNPYPLPGRSLEISRGGGGVLRAKILEAKYEAKLGFPGGGGGGRGDAKQIPFCEGNMDIFWNCTILTG